MKCVWINAAFLVIVSRSFAQLEEFESSATPPQSADDQNLAETGFGNGGGGLENTKYFIYQHLPEHDKYEFGYRRGNDHHVRERHEKAVPHEGHFKTKVRWADHHGGHGEHYWDYNHAGHHDDGDGEGSEHIPNYTEDSNNALSNPVPKIYTTPPAPFINEPIKRLSSLRTAPKDGFQTSQKPVFGGIKGVSHYGKQFPGGRTSLRPKRLMYDVMSGKVIDEITGKTYVLEAVNN